MNPRPILSIIIWAILTGSAAPIPAFAENTDLMLPDDQKKFETGDEQKARERREHRPMRRKRRIGKPNHRPLNPKSKPNRGEPPSSGNFDKDPDATVDHTH